MLVVGNLFDPATRYHGAVTVDRLLPRSRLLTLAGWGHTSLFASACVDAYVSTYLLTSRVPPKGTVCAARRGAVRRAGRRHPGRAGSRGAQQGRPDPVADAPAHADRAERRPATLSLTGRRLTTCLAS